MRVQVVRVESMPCNVEIWVKDTPDRFVIYVLEQLLSERAARLIELTLEYNVHNWRRSSVTRRRPALRLHTG